ncbi:hypothetical protein ATY36_02795 [Vibrio cidicii]|uniref:hypothetical protein n=1 Tax=Vibrio cidicii TaxID=1763883 RepID=UPI00078016B5|nr:hypothetical protein [Vibrio cidicii]KYN87781.1 hypothetical protein ATY36_02795 [Vibrio cidicii]
MEWDDVGGPLTYFGTVPVDMDSDIEVGEHAKLKAGDIEVKVRIINVLDDSFEGEVTEIGPDPRIEADGLRRGDVIDFIEQNIVTLYRG